MVPQEAPGFSEPLFSDGEFPAQIFPKVLIDRPAF